MTGVGEDAVFAAVLEAAGWFGDRRVDTGPAEVAWRARGYPVSDAAREFVASFDGIRFQYPQTLLPGLGRPDSCVLDAVEATGAIFESTVRSYEQRVLENLCPVGLAASRHLVLLISPSGRVYGGYDSFLGLYGEDGYQAVRRIFHRIKGSPVR